MHQNLSEEQRQSCQAWQETAHVCNRKSQNSEGAEGAVGEGESSEEECLKPPFVQTGTQTSGPPSLAYQPSDQLNKNHDASDRQHEPECHHVQMHYA